MIEIYRKASDDVDFEKVLFVVRAISDDASRPHMCVLHIERTKSGSRLVGTDGRRIHMAEIGERIPSGDYEVIVTKSTVILRGPVEGINFPNWKRIVPTKVVDRGIVDFGGAAVSKKLDQCANMAIAFSRVVEKTGAVVNLHFLDDLPKKEMSLLSENGKDKPIMLRREDAGKESLAVIMLLNPGARDAA